MGATSIEWTDYTFNICWGCQRVSPACKFCYAETFSKRVGLDLWKPQGERRTFGAKYWAEPLKWDRKAAKAGVRYRVFCCSMADVFEDHPTVAGERPKLWELIAKTPNLDWLLLTKRPENVEAMVPWHTDWPANVWLGTTVENQEYADIRIPLLISTSARLKFVSYEPALGPVNFDPPTCTYCGEQEAVYGDDGATPFCPECDSEMGFGAWLNPLNDGIAWVIGGGESGPQARAMHPEWMRDARDQCKEAGVPFLFKQWGEWRPDNDGDRCVSLEGRNMLNNEPGSNGDGTARIRRAGKKEAGRELDGLTWDGVPESPALESP